MPGVLDGTKGRGGWKLVSLVSFVTIIRNIGKRGVGWWRSRRRRITAPFDK